MAVLSFFLLKHFYLLDLGHSLFGALNVLPAVEMLFHRREREPVDFVALHRNVDLVQDILLGVPPHDLAKHLLQQDLVPAAVGLVKALGPPMGQAERVDLNKMSCIKTFKHLKTIAHLEEHEQALDVVERLLNGRSRDRPPVDGRQPERHLRGLGGGALDHLGLVQAHAPPLDARQRRGDGHEALGIAEP